MLACNSAIYEMFEFVDGEPYDGSLDATFSAGRILGLYHKLLADFRGDYAPPTGSYHNAKAIRQAIRSAPDRLSVDARPSPDELNGTVDYIEEAYDNCARQAEALGLSRWAVQIVHGDWHPGNMLFRDRMVVAVIDYDAARSQQRVIDLANGALQFSIIGGGEDLTRWPEYVDESRFKRFLRGYDSVNVVSVAEIKAVPYLMCEAAIAEAVLPIAATGSFGRMDGGGFLKMIERKVRWILSHLDELYATLDQ